MTLTDQLRIAGFIDDAKKQRQWLCTELVRLDPRSESYDGNQRAICGAIGELDKIIVNAIQTRVHTGRSRNQRPPAGPES